MQVPDLLGGTGQRADEVRENADDALFILTQLGMLVDRCHQGACIGGEEELIPQPFLRSRI